MTPFITEILDEINKDPSLLESKHKDNYAIRTILQYAFDKRMKMDLPEGEPPFKPDTAPIGMSPANFYQQVKKLYIFTRKDLMQVRREQLFIQLLESLHPSESKVVIAVKDQNLQSLYDNITADVVVKAGVVEEQYVFRLPKEEATEGRKLVVKIQDSTSADTTSVKVDAPKRGRPKKMVEQIVEPVPAKRGPGRPKKATS